MKPAFPKRPIHGGYWTIGAAVAAAVCLAAAVPLAFRGVPAARKDPPPAAAARPPEPVRAAEPEADADVPAARVFALADKGKPAPKGEGLFADLWHLDYDEAKALAKKSGKPLFVVFRCER